MNEPASDTSPAKIAPDRPASARDSLVRASRFSGGLALMLAAIAFVASAYLWYRLFYTHPELMEGNIAGQLEQVQGEYQGLRENLTGIEAQVNALREGQESVKSTVEKIHSDLARNRVEWLLTESEQLLVIANHRLQIARDVRSALSALRAADQQLKLVINPNMLPVRKELAHEISLLEVLDKTDVNGLALRLGTLAESIDRLPLAVDTRWPKDKPRPGSARATTKPSSTTDKESGWRTAWRTLWEDIASLVRLRTDVETQKPLLPPEQRYFLRENLRLLLQGAQNALLQGSVATYQQNVKAAARWVREYYDTAAQPVVATLAELDKLSSAKLAAELPDISGSLAALRRTGRSRIAP